MAISVLAPVKRKLDYPSSDGKPVAESDYQLTPLTYAHDGLRHYFRHRPDVHVAGRRRPRAWPNSRPCCAGSAVVIPDIRMQQEGDPAPLGGVLILDTTVGG